VRRERGQITAIRKDPEERELYAHLGRDIGELSFQEEEDSLTATMAGNLKRSKAGVPTVTVINKFTYPSP
jgi:hypothetical protein